MGTPQNQTNVRLVTLASPGNLLDRLTMSAGI
jgi:hypothetical protein